MSPDFEELSARLLALETVVGQLVTRMAVHTDDPARWLATRRVLALQAAGSLAREPGSDQLAEATRRAIADFFATVEHAVNPEGSLPQAAE